MTYDPIYGKEAVYSECFIKNKKMDCKYFWGFYKNPTSEEYEHKKIGLFQRFINKLRRNK